MHITNPGHPYFMIFNQLFLLNGPVHRGFVVVVPHDRDTRLPNHNRICSCMYSASAWSLLCSTGFFAWNMNVKRDYIRVSEIGQILAAFD